MNNLQLIVAWQSPTTRGWYPIGILSKQKSMFCFKYTHGVEEAKKNGFIPFRTMDNFTTTYLSDEFFPFFTNKILPHSRPEYKQYREWLNLSENDGVIEELARNNGLQATDNITLYVIPQKSKYYKIEFFAHGLTHLHQKGLEERLRDVKVGDRLYPMQDLQNPYDSHALLIRTQDPISLVGYIPRIYSADITKILKQDDAASICVKKVNDDSVLQFRLLCEFKAKWQEGFVPFQSKKFQTFSI